MPRFPWTDVGRDTDVKYNSGEFSDGNKEHVIRDWRKGKPCYKVAASLAELCSRVLRKAELVRNEIGYSVEISKQRVEAASFLLTTLAKHKRRERN